ncbi:hypothetical protein P153DRAFT_70300 [Dothidotthia symphoricarpi CBS 119687]|uniref:Uncharacterized protein n=1 Tax=Dothidotthia symphoricarpi CBS 119687 TaxID=1392245 RepID=A0A6A6A4Q9_9PLEO|nr:uncharacterized protein P153DRAFT_70300 [Dothidotthia symphoricarpi CBS 119687]KAF2126790.1 hypothetical protein P153DRAFT_70300 [Dothidotthia symphoricarpi CBS 119687]
MSPKPYITHLPFQTRPTPHSTMNPPPNNPLKTKAFHPLPSIKEEQEEEGETYQPAPSTSTSHAHPSTPAQPRAQPFTVSTASSLGTLTALHTISPPSTQPRTHAFTVASAEALGTLGALRKSCSSDFGTVRSEDGDADGVRFAHGRECVWTARPVVKPVDEGEVEAKREDRPRKKLKKKWREKEKDKPRHFQRLKTFTRRILHHISAFPTSHTEFHQPLRSPSPPPPPSSPSASPLSDEYTTRTQISHTLPQIIITPASPLPTPSPSPSPSHPHTHPTSQSPPSSPPDSTAITAIATRLTLHAVSARMVYIRRRTSSAGLQPPPPPENETLPSCLMEGGAVQAQRLSTCLFGTHSYVDRKVYITTIRALRDGCGRGVCCRTLVKTCKLEGWGTFVMAGVGLAAILAMFVSTLNWRVYMSRHRTLR